MTLTQQHERRRRGRVPVALAAAAALMAATVTQAAATTYRPNGLADLNAHMGQPCSAQASATRFNWHPAGYTYGNSYVAGQENAVINNIVQSGQYGLWYLVRPGNGFGQYNCRKIAGSTNYSVHSWGAALDTNVDTNPSGQTYWNGTGSDGYDYGTALPNIWVSVGNFYWGLHFSGTKDPMHFQYVTGY